MSIQDDFLGYARHVDCCWAGTMDLLPFRIDPAIRRALGTDVGDLRVLAGTPGTSPRLRGDLARPAGAGASFLIRVHTRSGIPVASVPVHVTRGDRSFEAADLTFLGMEGYAHLPPADFRTIEGRVWSRRAYATAAVLARGVVGHAPPRGGAC